MRFLHSLTFILLIVGALNWGVLAVTGWDIGELFGGMDAGLSKLIYVLVGLSALFVLFVDHKKACRYCGKQEGGQMAS